MLLGILFSLFILKTFAIQDGRDVCTLSSICNNVESIDSQVYPLREEQERQANLLEDLDRKLDTLLNNVDPLPANCYEALRRGQNRRISTIHVPEHSETPFQVACDQFSMGGGWTVLLRRSDGSENFYREWKDYKEGFGQLSNELFLGLDKLYAMTSSHQQELLVLMETQQGEQAYELYDNFKIGPESNNYTLESAGTPSGDAGDSLSIHVGMMFSTKDRKNDLDPNRNCAEAFTGAWWYYKCHDSNLAGQYGDDTYAKGICWKTFNGYYNSLKRAVMMIRPKVFSYKCF
ncbi:ryncolin-4-like isoform X1 [Drosophila takahashii]|uniref:ryncolin-4-like isoform X1 n=1 Tax=Drosophila takahashii TaxID=29030 RepID=UPI001CF90D6B|nr:ryncolin-4-like isoform X1 [Drosophila takahashii]